MRSSEEAGAAVDATWSVDGYGECVVATGLYVEKPGYKIPIYIYIYIIRGFNLLLLTFLLDPWETAF